MLPWKQVMFFFLNCNQLIISIDHGSPVVSVGVAKDGLNVLVATAVSNTIILE